MTPTRPATPNLGTARHGTARGLGRWVNMIVRRRSAQRVPRQVPARRAWGLSNALIESTNTKIRLITRIAFGSRPCPAPAGPARPRPATHKPRIEGSTHPQTPD